jgi:hypothetical protein
MSGVKMREEVTSRRGNAREAAIEVVRKVEDTQWEDSCRAAGAKQQAGSQRLQVQLSWIFQQTVQDHNLAGLPPPTLESFIQALHSQTPNP